MTSHEIMNKKLKLIYRGGMFLTNEKMQISIEKRTFGHHQESLEPCEAEMITWT